MFKVYGSRILSVAVATGISVYAWSNRDLILGLLAALGVVIFMGTIFWAAHDIVEAIKKNQANQ